MTVGELLDVTTWLLRQPPTRDLLDDYRACRRAIVFLSDTTADESISSILADMRTLLRTREHSIINAIQSPHRAGEARGATVSQRAADLHARVRAAHAAAVQSGVPLTRRALARRFAVTDRTIRTALKNR